MSSNSIALKILLYLMLSKVNMATSSENYNSSYARYVSLMYKAMDTTIDPLVNFIGYARGNFCREDYNVSKGDYLPVLNGNSYDNVLANEEITFPSIVKARNYRKSYEEEIKHLLKNKAFNQMYGTFPAFDENWKSENFDWIKASAILSAMHFRLTISYNIDYLDDGRSIILSIIPPDEEPISKAREVLLELKISDDKISDIISDVELITEKFEKITPQNGYPDFVKVKFTYGELKKERFDYQKFLETVLVDPLNDDDFVYLNNLEPGYFEKFLNIFEEVGPKAMANYITFKYAYKVEKDYYSSTVALYHFRPAVLAAGYSTFWNEDIGRKRKEIFTIFTNSINKIKDKFKQDITERLNTFTIKDEVLLEFIKINYNQQEIEKEYEDIDIDPNNFFQNFLNIRKHGVTPSTRKYILMDKKDDIQGQAVRLLDFLIQHHNRPAFFYFAGWELERMWKNTISEYRFEEDSEEYKSLVSIVEKEIKDRQLPVGIIKDDFWVKQDISSIAALKLALQDYKIWLSENAIAAKEEEEILRKFNLTCSQAFFISFVQHSYASKGVMLNIIILSLSHSHELIEAFGGIPDTVKNPLLNVL